MRGSGFLGDLVVDVLKEKVAEPWRGKEPDRDSYRIGLRQQSFVRGHRLLKARDDPICQAQELLIFYPALQLLPEFFVVHGWIAFSDVQLQDVLGMLRIFPDPLLDRGLCSVRSFSRYASAAERIGAMQNDLFENANECVMHTLIWPESRDCDVSGLLLNAIVDSSHCVLGRYEGFLIQHPLQLQRVSIDVLQDLLDFFALPLMSRRVLDRFLQVVDVSDVLE